MNLTRQQALLLLKLIPTSKLPLDAEAVCLVRQLVEYLSCFCQGCGRLKDDDTDGDLCRSCQAEAHQEEQDRRRDVWKEGF